MKTDDFSKYLQPTPYFDYQSENIRAFADQLSEGLKNPRDIAIRFYNAVRDQIRYNPYVFSSKRETFRASYALEKKETYCIPKAVLLGAMARYKGIPACLGLSDVQNHLASPQFVALLRTNIFAMHGFIKLYLDGQWVTATPAFNKDLCTLMGVAPLEFDGKQDSIFQEFTPEGHLHMEYLKSYGEFAEVPVELITQVLTERYPHLFKVDSFQEAHSFE
ncbi:MAG: transglutaminase family protein [Planctomycetota bacterium]